ncbi:methyltransferase domain-containing protein [Mesobacillus zeae]|uniref:Methyltransferase domain-containing protein n=1 Tax=Mesobacillus zeae TaxID=1917180 RepID=A0A398BAD2_9BACI|nr:methyltransferase domain-containing protein [Mesobacillus zeae]RID86777.1 methyltransferase domain-containing protein [Mesobacillus zeae]
MRIGKFGESNRLSIDTIRHYMDIGLIVPEKRGGQYFFDERCQGDLDLILEFKGMGLSLLEIKTILLYRNLAQYTPYEEDAFFQALFTDKYNKLNQDIKELTDTRDRLKRKLDELSKKIPATSTFLGIDLSVLSILRCRKCGEKLDLQDGRITKNQVVEGNLGCPCGEEYVIDSGILIVGEPDEPAQTPQLQPFFAKYFQMTDPIYLENLYHGLHWAKRKMISVELQGKVLLELGSGYGFFLRNVYQELPEDSVYIAVDRDLDLLRFLKGILERTGLKRRILFICSDFLDIPVGPHSVDMLIDHAGSSNYGFEHKEFLLKEVDDLIKKEGYLLGSYIAFKNFSKRSKIEPQYRHNFNAVRIKENIERLDYIPIDEKTSHYMDKGGEFENFFVDGEEVFSYSFMGKR